MGSGQEPEPGLTRSVGLLRLAFGKEIADDAAQNLSGRHAAGLGCLLERGGLPTGQQQLKFNNFVVGTAGIGEWWHGKPGFNLSGERNRLQPSAHRCIGMRNFTGERVRRRCREVEKYPCKRDAEYAKSVALGVSRENRGSSRVRLRVAA